MSRSSILLIGAPGCGKTTTAASAPGPVLFIDVDNKIHKMANMQDKLKSGQVIQWAVTEKLALLPLKSIVNGELERGKVTRPKPKGYFQIAEMIDKLAESKCIIEHEGKKVKVETVVLDSYTSMNEHLKVLLMAANDTNMVSLPMYGTMLSNYEYLNDSLLSLDANVILICHEKVDKDELTGKITYHPLIDGQMKDKLGKYFEEVYFMEKSVVGDKVRFELLTIGSAMKACRTSRVLPSKVEPDLSKVLGGGYDQKETDKRV